MLESFYIAWRYVSFYRLRTLVLVTCITLIAALPLALEVLLGESERQLLDRAASTPLLLGAHGSALDLAMNSLYFDDEIPQTISLQAAEAISASRLATGIPLYVRFRARGHSIVGTTLDYFDLRDLRIAAGRQMVRLGECVLGAGVAEQLGLHPGDSLLSSPETVFDLAGVYPLKMKIAGVLERAHTPDDFGVFVDIKTAWVIEGLGHGHEDLARSADDSVIIERTANNVTANARLMQYHEITADNLGAFHFHGDISGYPLTAAIAVPRDTRAGTILRGRYLDNEAGYQLIRPAEVIDGLLENIFRIKQVIDGVVLIVGAATLLAIMLVFALSVRLRARELDTITRLGCSRTTVAQLLLAEMLIIVLLSAALVAGMLAVIGHNAEQLVRLLIVG